MKYIIDTNPTLIRSKLIEKECAGCNQRDRCPFRAIGTDANAYLVCAKKIKRHKGQPVAALQQRGYEHLDTLFQN